MNIFAVFILAKSKTGKFAMTTRPDGGIGLPGGKIDNGEDLCTAALREASEEGWILKLTDNKPFCIQIINGKPCAWITGEILGYYIEYKEKHRGIIPFYGTIGDICTSGFGNEIALNKYLNINRRKNE